MLAEGPSSWSMMAQQMTSFGTVVEKGRFLKGLPNANDDAGYYAVVDALWTLDWSLVKMVFNLSIIVAICNMKLSFLFLLAMLLTLAGLHLEFVQGLSLKCTWTSWLPMICWKQCSLTYANWLQYIMLIHVFCVCLFVTSEISGTGRCSVTLLSPTWRPLPCELHWLLFELIWSMVQKKKGFRTFLQVTPETTPFTLQKCNT